MMTGEDSEAEFWSQDPVAKDEGKGGVQTIAQQEMDKDNVDSYGDALNKASNEDIYAFSVVASSDEGVSTFLQATHEEPTIADAEGDPQMMATFIDNLKKKSSTMSSKEFDEVRK